MTGPLQHPAGTKVFCRAGHHVCTIVKDLHKHDTNYASRVSDWQEDQMPPAKGDLLPLKCFCGEPYTGFFPRFPWTDPPALT